MEAETGGHMLETDTPSLAEALAEGIGEEAKEEKNR